MKRDRRRILPLPSVLVVLTVVLLIAQTSALAVDLTGCWVGKVDDETTYLYFQSNSKCSFNQHDNCEVSYPLTSDPLHNIQLDWNDESHDLKLLGNVQGRDLKGDGFSFSR